MSQSLSACVLSLACLAPGAVHAGDSSSQAEQTFCGLPFGISREDAEQTLLSKGLPILRSGLTDIEYDASSLLFSDRSGILLRSECGTECEARFSPIDGLLSGITVECLPRPRGKPSQDFFDALSAELTMEIGPPSDSQERSSEVTREWQTDTATIRLLLGKRKDDWRVLLVADWSDAQWPLLAGVGKVSSPRLIPGSKVEPVFPKEAREESVEGSVILQAVVLKDGTVVVSDVLRCSRPGFGFEEAAIESVSQWRYEPALIDGEPVAVYFTIFVDFKRS